MLKIEGGDREWDWLVNGGWCDGVVLGYWEERVLLF